MFPRINLARQWLRIGEWVSLVYARRTHAGNLNYQLINSHEHDVNNICR